MAIGLLCCLCTISGLAQNYQAINGSMYAGSLAAGNNPASIVHVPYAWDVTPLAIQLKHSSNGYTIQNYSLLSSPANASIVATNGVKNRFVMANQNLRLMNARIKLNRTSAIAFGATIRNYLHGTSSQTNYQDTVFSLADFLRINVNRQPLGMQGAASAWGELYGSYATTVMDDGYRLLNAGITLKLNRQLGGGYTRAEGITYLPYTDAVTNRQSYLLTQGRLQYGYSSNIDLIDSGRSAEVNTKAFLKDAYFGVSADIGIEYIFLAAPDEAEADEYSYTHKIAVSIMDIGGGRYRHSSRSRLASSVKQGINDTLIENKFKTINNIDDFNDSLSTIVNSMQTLTGDFVIYQPTRLVINADHRITNQFFINAELSLPLASLAGGNIIYLKDINLLAITPRWETRRLGAYLPISFNSRKQLWVGAAFRAGPLLLGIHNFGNLFSKNSMQNGGLYLALTIRPGKWAGRVKGDSPTLNKKQLQHLYCPAL
jgi:hypothetical protein